LDWDGFQEFLQSGIGKRRKLLGTLVEPTLGGKKKKNGENCVSARLIWTGGAVVNLTSKQSPCEKPKGPDSCNVPHVKMEKDPGS